MSQQEFFACRCSVCRDCDHYRSIRTLEPPSLAKVISTLELRSMFWCIHSPVRVVYLALSTILGGKRKALNFIIPFLHKYEKEREIQEQKSVSSYCDICWTRLFTPFLMVLDSGWIPDQSCPNARNYRGHSNSPVEYQFWKHTYFVSASPSIQTIPLYSMVTSVP